LTRVRISKKFWFLYFWRKKLD